ncbi:MAG: hypothetical protein HOP08_17515 [Cyclobacteriaceae bacterium]|nr:hypothetical protein [Cyclobacteriaceae bacterium]
MKTIILSLIIACSSACAFSNDAKYFETMGKSIEQVYRAQTIEEIQQAVNVLDRVGNSEKTKWEPFYYASFGYVLMATKEGDGTKKDSYLDQAQLEIDKAIAINANESEIVTLQGFIHTIRVTVDPRSRGQKYSSLAMQSYGKANKLNPENPRALGLMAQMQFGTARFLNASTAEACATAKIALEKFASYKSENVLAPVWGKETTAELLNQCK